MPIASASGSTRSDGLHLPTSLGLGNQFYIFMQFSLDGFVGENQRIEPGIMDFFSMNSGGIPVTFPNLC